VSDYDDHIDRTKDGDDDEIGDDNEDRDVNSGGNIFASGLATAIVSKLDDSDDIS